MAFINDRADAVASMLEKFTTAHAYQVAGQYANIDFWISETLHALEAIADYNARFERMSVAQREWVDAHDVVVGSYCPLCGGNCELDSKLKPPSPPTKMPTNGRNEATRRLKDAFYLFILRCCRMNLVDERTLRENCSRVGTSAEARDLVRK